MNGIKNQSQTAQNLQQFNKMRNLNQTNQIGRKMEIFVNRIIKPKNNNINFHKIRKSPNSNKIIIHQQKKK